MPSGIQSYPAQNQSTSGYRVLNPNPLDVYLGPWEAIGSGPTAGTTSGGVSLANSIISPSVRYQGQQLIIIANSTPGESGGETLAYKYWYRGGTADENLVEFSSGAGGEPFDPDESYNWTAPQYFSQGFSAAGGVTFNNNVVFNNGLSVSGGATFSSIYGTGLGIGTFYPNPVGSAEINNSGIITATGIKITNTGNGATFSNKVFVGELLSVEGGISANGGVTFANNVHVGGTLSVEGNFYVAGTLTTVNESQLLIQDKYLVLASGAVDGAAGLCAGIYIGSTTSAFASFAYSNDVGNGRWVSNKPMYVNNDLVLTWGNISQIGVTAERLEIKDTTSANIDFSLLMSEPISTNGIGNFVYADVTSPKITYNPSTSTLTVNQVEAIVDGGTW